MSLMGQDDTVVNKTVSNFGFSAVPVDALESDEQTLTVIALDRSGSIYGFKDQLVLAYQEIIRACRQNPRSESLVVRATSFGSDLNEEHGFVGVNSIDENSFDLRIGGATALSDAALDAIETIETYGKQLGDMDYLINGLVVIVTDGGENSSRVANEGKIKAAIERMRKDESLESLKGILIGLGCDSDRQYYEAYSQNCGFDQCVHITDTSAKGIAKMGDFVSRSISSSSQALGSGGPSQNLVV